MSDGQKFNLFAKKCPIAVSVVLTFTSDQDKPCKLYQCRYQSCLIETYFSLWFIK